MSPVRRTLTENAETFGNDPNLVERIHGINIETGHLRVGDSGREFYVPRQPPVLLCYIAGQDFELPDECEAAEEVGAAVIGNTCSIYGKILLTGDVDVPVVEFDLPSEVVPLFPVYQNALWIDGNDYYSFFLTISLSGRLKIRGGLSHDVMSAHTTVQFGPAQYIIK